MISILNTHTHTHTHRKSWFSINRASFAHLAV